VLNVDINLLRTFLEIARTRHFGKAAENLYLTQAAISARVKLLEETLGVSLFERHRNNIQLTKQGDKLVVYATEMLELWSRTTQEIRVPQNYQDLTIAAPESVWSSKLNGLPNRLFKNIKTLQLNVVSLDSSQIIKRLLNRTIDIGFVFDKPKIDELTLVGSFDISLALYSDQVDLCIADINEENFVSIDLGASFKQLQAKLLPNVSSPIFQASNWQMAVDYITEFSGVALLPKSVAAKKKKLSRLVDSHNIERKVYVCCAKSTSIEQSKMDYINQALNLIETL
jgi:LysR family transcriptional regulator, flagellar master operon regulator